MPFAILDRTLSHCGRMLRSTTALFCALLLQAAWTARPAPAQDTFPQCDGSLWQHVYHAYRLQVLRSCVAVAGTVEEIRHEKDGDDHILVRLDSDYESLLNASNITDEDGALVVEPVCEHAVTQAVKME